MKPTHAHETEQSLMAEYDLLQESLSSGKFRGDQKRISQVTHRQSEILDVIANMRRAADKQPIRGI